MFPAASLAPPKTCVVPTGKVEPEGGSLEKFTPGQLSVAETTKFTGALHCPGVLETTIGDGQLREGDWRSSTLTVKVQLALLLSAVAVTVVAPTGNTEPDAGESEILPHVPEVVGVA